MNKQTPMIPTHVSAAALVVAEENPRSNDDVNLEQIEQLAQNIQTLGLLTPLVGYLDDEGSFHVTAGGRRTRALHWLMAHEGWDADAPVPVKCMDRADAIRAGHGEQLSHQKMSELDELRLFNTEGYEHSTDDVLAKYIGKSARYVAQQRKVLTLPSHIVEAIMESRITVDQGRGLTYWMDDEDGLEEWFDRAVRTDTSGAQIQSAYFRRAVPWHKHPYRDLVSEEAYLEAGGTLQTDLFGDSKLIQSPQVMEDLAALAAHKKVQADHPGYDDYVKVSNLWDLRTHRGIPQMSEDQQERWSEIRWDFHEEDADEERVIWDSKNFEGDELFPEKDYAEWQSLKAISDNVYPDELRGLLILAYCLGPYGNNPIQVREGVLPQDLEPLYEAGYLERPAVTKDEGEAPAADDPDTLSGALTGRIKRIKLHCIRNVLIKKPNDVLALYLEHLTERYSQRFSHVPQGAAKLDEDADPTGVWSAAWEKAQGLAPKAVEDVAAMSPGDQRTVIALRMLDCLDVAQIDKLPDVTDAKVLRELIHLDARFFKAYKKPQKIAMIQAASEKEVAGLENLKAAALDEELERLYKAQQDWLPIGF